jgi:carboxyl-terminal processing protease
MKSIFKILLGLLPISLSAQLGIHPDSLYVFIKHNGIMGEKVDWKTVDSMYGQQIKEAKSIKDTMNTFVKVLEQMNDVHTSMYYQNQYYGHYQTLEDSTIARLTPLLSLSNKNRNTIGSKIIAGNVAYLSIPSLHPNGQEEINKKAQEIYDLIAEMYIKGCKSMIIDLRLNGGGNVYPMATGLSAVFGTGVLGYNYNRENDFDRTWTIKNNVLFLDDYQTAQIDTKKNLNFTNIPVVVLIGPVTMSSGSITSIFFKGRPNRKIIGEPTASGYTTATYPYQMSPSLTVTLSTNYVADRNKKLYRDSVNPDILVYGGDDFDDFSKDLKVQRALKELEGLTLKKSK